METEGVIKVWQLLLALLFVGICLAGAAISIVSLFRRRK
jgi:hypothetical protein